MSESEVVEYLVGFLAGGLLVGIVLHWCDALVHFWKGN